MTRREVVKALSGGVAGLPLVKSIERVSASPDDVAVITTERQMRPESIHTMSLSLKQAFPNNKILIIEGPGVDLKIVRNR